METWPHQSPVFISRDSVQTRINDNSTHNQRSSKNKDRLARPVPQSQQEHRSKQRQNVQRAEEQEGNMPSSARIKQDTEGTNS